MALETYRVLEKPLVTEKGSLMTEDGNWVTFQVHRLANKLQIKQAVEAMFKVTVLKVNTLTVKPKYRRFGRFVGKTRQWKKAMVLLKDGDKIDFFEGA